MALLDVYVASPGMACLLDDRKWYVNVYDAHFRILRWGDPAHPYTKMEAPAGHWAGSVPPGIYVVSAVRFGSSNETESLTTDYAIAIVDCGETACVRLFVRPGAVSLPPSGCELSIDGVVGLIRQDSSPTTARVHGTARACEAVNVTLSNEDQTLGTAAVDVSPDGSWTIDVEAREGLRYECHEPVVVSAVCEGDPECRTELALRKLDCRRDPNNGPPLH